MTRKLLCAMLAIFMLSGILTFGVAAQEHMDKFIGTPPAVTSHGSEGFAPSGFGMTTWSTRGIADEFPNNPPKSVDTVEEKVDWIAEKCRESGATEEWEIALWLHDWLIYNANYDYTFYYYHPDGVLLKGTGVCQSYAEAYALLLDEFSIENIFLGAYEMNHAWNLVKIDGEWCHIDCTWDDPGEGGYENHNYFGMTDKMISADHIWNTDAYMACTSKINYYPVRMGYLVCETKEEYLAILDEQAALRAEEIDVYYIGGDPDFAMRSYYLEWLNNSKSKYNIGGYGYTDYGLRLTARLSYWGGHTHYYQTTVTNPTCTEDGYTEYRCSCGNAFIDDYVDALGHDMGEWEISQEATCTEDGSKRRDCERCDHFVEEVLPATEHSYVDGVCSVCGEKELPVSGTCGENLTWTLGTDGTLTISGIGKMYNYYCYGIAAPWHNYREEIVKVIVEDGVTSIGQFAIWECDNMTSITIPDSVTEIGYYAFSECESMTSITIPDSVTEIGDQAFTACTSLTNICIPDSITEIAAGTFAGCSSLTSITIPESVITIGSGAFSGCSSLTSITIPESVTKIGSGAFSGCSSLTSITIPESVITIGKGAFSGCSSLTNVTFPENIHHAVNIESDIFSECTSLTSITLPHTLYSATVYGFAGCSNLTSVTFCCCYTRINEYTFDGCENLKDVYFYGSEKQWNRIDIKDYNEPLNKATIHFIDSCKKGHAFGRGVCAHCGITGGYCGDTSVNKGRNLLWTFEEDIGLVSIYGIGDMADYDYVYDDYYGGHWRSTAPWGYPYYSIPRIIIEDGVTSIGKYAFAGGRRALTSVIIPASVTEIREGAFFDRSSIEDVYYGGTAEQWNTLGSGTPDAEYVHYSCTTPENHWKSESADATCTEDGYLGEVCACGYTRYKEIIPKLNHDMNEAWTITKEATCTEDGAQRRDCERCDYFETEAITTPGHQYTSVVTPPTTTEQGYTTHTCISCGDSYVDSYIDPIPLPTNANVELARMILGNELAMQFAFKQELLVPGAAYTVVITKTYADGRENNVIVVPQDQWKTMNVSGVPHYYVSFNGIAAKEMCDTIYIQLMANGTTPIGQKYTDSIRDYALRQLRKTTDAKTRTLYVDMLNYGAAAQTYFKYHADELANAELTAAEKEYGTKTVNLVNNRVPGPGYVASQLNLASSIQLRLKFNGIDASMYAVASFTNHMGNQKNVTIPGSEFISGGTVVVINDVVAADYDKDVTITVYDVQGNAVASAVEGVASYIARMTGGSEIYEAVAKYCAAAYGYLHRND